MQSPASSSSATATATATATVDSSMGDNTSSHRYTSPKSTSLTTANLNPHSPLFGEADDIDGDSNDGDPAVWAAFTQNFRQVQSVLDRNRVLIQQVNENHQSKVHDNLVKNVTLIQELNGNISKVVSLYSDLSSNFSNVVQQRNGSSGDAKSNSSRKK